MSLKKGLSFAIRFLAMMIAVCVSLGYSYAQNRTIRGTVVDTGGEPVIGAAVTVVGNTRIGAATDLNGAFSLNVPAGATISVESIGYKTQTFAVGNQSVFNVVLEEDTEMLEETVVIGYGVQKKSDVTGAIASLKSDDLQNRSSTDAIQAMQGKAAGVQIVNSSGAPGATSNIQIRGYSSNSKTTPLMIVDGLKVRSIDYLDPENIASMEILPNAIVMSSFEKIAVGGGFNTKLYDKDLNLIAEHDDIYLGDGTYFRDWHGFGDGDMFFDSISYADTVYNLNTGARIVKEDGFFYSFEYGYIVADNVSNGNDPVKKWRVYDGNFNLVMEGTGDAYTTQDEVTGEVFIYSFEDGKTTIYSLTNGEELFSLDNLIYNINVVDGRFFGANKTYFFMTDRNGSNLFEYQVEHKTLRFI